MHRILRLSFCGVVAALVVLSLAVGIVWAQQSLLTVTENPVGNSGVSATVTFDSSGPDQLSITVSAQGLPPGSTSISEVFFGTCAEPRGIRYDLDNLIAGPDGKAKSTSVFNFNSVAPLQDGDHGVYIHDVTQAGTILACGDIPVPQTPQPTTMGPLMMGDLPTTLVPVGIVGAMVVVVGLYVRRGRQAR